MCDVWVVMGRPELVGDRKSTLSLFLFQGIVTIPNVPPPRLVGRQSIEGKSFAWSNCRLGEVKLAKPLNVELLSHWTERHAG